MKYLAKVIEKFVPLTGMDIPPYSDTKLLAQLLLENENTIYIEEEDKGAILGMLAPMWWNPSVLIAQEFGWWVEPEYRGTALGIRLLKSFEHTAKARGASKVLMVCLETQTPDKIEQIYTRMGYTRTERVFAKEV